MSITTETLAAVIGGLGATLTGLFKAFRFVREGERGIKLQFGRACRDDKNQPIIIEPGFVLLIPFVQTLACHHVRQQSYRFPDQHITLKDGLIYRIGGMVIFKVVDIYKALFDIESIDHSIDDLCMAAIRDELQQLNHEELRDFEKISKNLLTRVKARANQWGIEIVQFSLPECAPTPETANLINAALGVKLRLAALSSGLAEHKMSLENVSPNLAAVLIGIPLTATLQSDKKDVQSGNQPTSEAGVEKNPDVTFSVDSQ